MWHQWRLMGYGNQITHSSFVIVCLQVCKKNENNRKKFIIKKKKPKKFNEFLKACILEMAKAFFSDLICSRSL